MSEILQQFKSPVFWFTGVFLGLILQVGGTYLMRYIDKTIPNWNQRRALRNEEAVRAWREEVERCRNNPARILYHQARLVILTGTSVLFLVWAATFALIAVDLAPEGRYSELHPKEKRRATKGFVAFFAFSVATGVSVRALGKAQRRVHLIRQGTEVGAHEVARLE